MKTKEVKSVKHTPSPWRVGKYGTSVLDYHGFNVADANETLVLEGWNREQHGVMHWSAKPGVTYREIPEEEAAANAALIAAAPDLLERLEWALTIIEGSLPHVDTSAARAVIEKATTL